ncbi:hypothetical protein [Hyunsoonleella rubra]|uniref:Glycosyltransferase family 1 protein n=1 Tax=Hyunsoonleella rubra TaxID=1737062 RepID=A0ABW5TAX8_9FLAO
MKALFKCELHYFPSLHLCQVYDGFEKLRKLGIIDLKVVQASGDATIPVAKVIIDNKYTVIYDTLDGFNWISDSIPENLNYFKSQIRADYYFKRSFNESLLEFAPKDCNIYPLGLNIGLQPESSFKKGFKESFKDFIKGNYLVSKFYKKTAFYSNDFEFYPIANKNNKVLFITRLWDSENVSLEHLKSEREQINKDRVDCINVCKKEFGDRFTGGLQENPFTLKYAKELIIPNTLTNRQIFLKTIREHNICIATAGLHGSIGWKFGEYVAASRAIISEPLEYAAPGEFKNNKNYFTFKNKEELLAQTHSLLKNRDLLNQTMRANYQYYHNFMRPDKMILNTLLKLYEDLI